jgi:hypothetical protein
MPLKTAAVTATNNVLVIDFPDEILWVLLAQRLIRINAGMNEKCDACPRASVAVARSTSNALRVRPSHRLARLRFARKGESNAILQPTSTIALSATRLSASVRLKPEFNNMVVLQTIALLRRYNCRRYGTFASNIR